MTPKIVSNLSMPTIGTHCVTIAAVCVNVHVSDNRETLPDVEASCLHVDTMHHSDVSDDREKLCDKKSGLLACSRER